MRWLASLLLLALTASAPAPDDKTYLVSGFDRIRVDGPFEVEVVTGPTRASASGDTAALRRLNVRVDGGTLVVSAGADGFNLPTGATLTVPKVRVQTPMLKTVLVNGGGRVRVGAMRGAKVDIGLNGGGAVAVGSVTADDLGVTLTGTGVVTVAGSAQRTRIRSNGAGSVDAAGLMTGDAVLISESSGGMKIGVRYTVQVFAMGLGTVQVLGKPDCRISGNGPALCEGKITRR